MKAVSGRMMMVIEQGPCQTLRTQAGSGLRGA
jgi:hypothetical protein